MISISFFEVSCQSYVSLVVMPVVTVAWYTMLFARHCPSRRALAFLSAVAFFHGFCDRG